MYHLAKYQPPSDFGGAGGNTGAPPVSNSTPAVTDTPSPAPSVPAPVPGPVDLARKTPSEEDAWLNRFQGWFGGASPSPATATPSWNPVTNPLAGTGKTAVPGLGDAFGAVGDEPNFHDLWLASHLGSNLLEHVLYTTRYAFGWVFWEYADWVTQLRNWSKDGYSLVGLVTHTTLLWRTLVVAGVSAGIFQFVTLLPLLYEMSKDLIIAIKDAFQLAGEGLDFLARMFRDALESIQRLFGKK